MHLVVVSILALHGQERASADVQRHERMPDATLRKALQKALGEVQASRRRSHGPFLSRENGLIGGAIALGGRTPARDIGRQRRIAEHVDGLVEVGAVQGERQLDLATLTFSGHGRVKRPKKADAALVAETDEIADLEPLGRAGESAPATLVNALM